MDIDLRVLLVDDDDDDAAAFQQLLAETGHRVVIQRAHQGAEAIALLASLSDAELPELIVLDLNMPIMNGQDFLDRLRQDPRHQNLPVLVLTTTREGDILADVLRRGAQAALSKPYTPDEHQVVKQMIVDFWFHGALTPPFA